MRGSMADIQSATAEIRRGKEKDSPKFHPHWCNDKSIGPPKLKFLQRFDQNVEYKRPYALRDFHQIRRICTPFQDALAIEISLDLLKRLWSYGGF